MGTINDLCVTSSVDSSDKLVVWKSADGVTRSLPVSVLDDRYFMLSGDPLPIEKGGTGANNAHDAFTNIINGSTVPVTNGGTGANTALSATTNLQVRSPETGSVARSVQSKSVDTLTLTDFGAVGDGTTDNSAAITSANGANGPVFVPKGTYYAASLTNGGLTGSYWGHGQIKTNDGNKHAKISNQLTAPPSSYGAPGGINTAFNGDLSKQALTLEHRISGAATLGQPATGYQLNPETAATFQYLYNTSGWNQSTSQNDGRTEAMLNFAKVDNYGQGDCVAYAVAGFVSGGKPGATSTLANPAVTIMNGECDAGSNGVYLNPIEINCVDQGFDVSGVNFVGNARRANDTGALQAFWYVYRAQSGGPKPIDVHFSATGPSKFGVDLSYGDFSSTNGAAIAMKADQKIFGNVTATDSLSRYPVTTNDWISYSSSLGGWNIVANNSPSLQVKSTSVLTPVALIAQSTLAVTGAVTASSSITATGPIAANGNDALLYSNASSQSIPNNAATTITGWTKTTDRLSTSFNASTGVFTAPASGYYEVNAQITWAGAVSVVGGTYLCNVVANGSTVITGTHFSETTANIARSAKASGTVFLSAGQTVVIQGYQNSGAAVALAPTGTQTTLSIVRIP